MSHNSLQSVRDALILARAQQYITDAEFILLYEYNWSKPLFPYWKFESFNVDTWDDEECRTELRFAKTDLPLLKQLLGVPDKICCRQGTTCSGMEGLCVLLKRLAYPCRYTDMQAGLGKIRQNYVCYLMNCWIWCMNNIIIALRVGISLFCHQSCFKVMLTPFTTRVPH